MVINILQPYPGTKVREMILQAKAAAAFKARISASCRRFGNATVEVNDLSRHRLIWLQKIGLLRFYLRPRVLWRNLKMYHPKAFLMDGLAFMRALCTWGAG